MAELVFENVTVGYEKKPLIPEVNFELNQGEILALAGPNGAGKSTILKTAAGILDAISGKVLIQGHNIAGFLGKELARIVSVMLTERIKTNYMTCFDVVRVGRYQYTDIFGNLREEDRKAIKECMELIGVWHLKDADFSKLSDGQKQRVLLARAIVSEPKLLILDEPTSFLDMGYKVEFFDVLRKLAREKNVAVLISMHEMELIKKVADQVVCISKGNRIDRVGDPVEVLSPEYMENLFSMRSGKYEEYYGKH